MRQADPDEFDPEAVRAVAGQLAAQGVLVDARQASGDRTLVLRIEEVERYAGALILAARNNPRGVPALEERQLASPAVPLPGIKKKSRLERLQERVVLECVAQLLVEHGICFRHEGLMVFPSLFRAAASSEEPLAHTVSLYYDFSGAIDNIYASLVAWLALLTSEFGAVRLWGDRAELKGPHRGACGVRKVERGRGFARLDVFFDGRTDARTRELFRSFVEDHLRRHGLDIAEHVEVTCPGCGYAFAEDDIHRRIQAGKADIGCVNCDGRIDLEEAMIRGRQRDPGVERRKVALLTRLERGRRQAVKNVRRAFNRGRGQGDPGEPLRVLHLSDLHFARTSNVQNALQPLVADITDRDGGLGFSRLDYLVVSGDLTDRASQVEFDKARRFISKLIDRFQLTAERCVIVPGNHDQSWDADVYDWRPRRQVRDKDLRPGAFVEQGDGYLLRDDARYGQRFANFDEHFYHPLLQLPYPLEAAEQAVTQMHADTGLQFLGLNSAWQVDEWFRDRSSIHPGALSRGLARMEQQVKDRKKKAPLLRVAVWHHPVTGSEKIDDDAFMTRLRQAGVRLVLHGHVHEDRADLFSYMHPHRIYIAGAGSFGAPAKDRPESTPRLYNLLEVSRELGRVRVFTRKLSREGEAWGPWAVWEGDSPNDKRAYYDIEL